MFFDKLLDFLKIENLYKNSDFKTPITQVANTNASEHVPTGECANSHCKQVHEVLDFWSHHQYVRNNYTYYREPSSKEKAEYALINILSCFSKSARGFDSFSPTSLNNLGIINIQSYLKKIEKKGYIIRADITDTIFAKYNMNELKVIADSIGIHKSGKKRELAQRIAVELSPKQINQILKENELYIISDKGKERLIGNEDYVPLHRYLYCVSLAEFNDNRIPEGGIHPRNFYDTMFQILSNRKFFFECQGNFEDAGRVSHFLYNTLLEELRKTTHSVPLSIILNYYVEYVYIYSCFCFRAHSALAYQDFSSSYNWYVLPRRDEKLSIVADQEQNINYDALLANKPPSFLTTTEFKEYIHELLSQNIFDAKKWDDIIKSRIMEYDHLVISG